MSDQIKRKIFEPHGNFDLTLIGDILIITFYNNWNLEGAKEFFTHYKKFLKERNVKKFAVLSDLSQFAGGTPEAITFFDKIADWAKENGQVARALIVDSSLKEYTINEIDKGKIRYPVRNFDDRTEALEWFKSLGLSIL